MSQEPTGLRELQARFAAAMCAPLTIDGTTGDYELCVERYPVELVRDMVPRLELTGVQRLAVYNQQYWFRLLAVMQEEYPLLTALLGEIRFNRMAVAYLDAHPSRSPLLRHLTDALPQWMTGEHPWRRPELIQCAAMEHAWIVAFDAAALPILDAASADPARLLSQPLRLQPHLRLVHETWDLVDARRSLRDDPAQVELVEREGWWAIYRGEALCAERLGPMQHRLLALLSTGSSLQGACDAVIAESDEARVASLASNIQGWFTRWMRLGWFCAD